MALITHSDEMPPSGFRRIRPSEWTGTVLLAARDAAGVTRQLIAAAAPVQLGTFRLSELSGDTVRIVPTSAEAVAEVYEKLGVTVWVSDTCGFHPANGEFVIVRRKATEIGGRPTGAQH